MTILPRTFYDRDTPLVARDLIGKIIIRRFGNDEFKGIIAETEAYRSDDPACHACRGKTERNSALFGPVGHTYVYLSYGLHYCINVVSRDTKKFPAGGVLIRGVIAVKEQEMGKEVPSHLISGPGNVGKVLAIDRSYSGIDITNPDSQIVIAKREDIDASFIDVTGRIGISVAKDIPWRFALKKSFISQLISPGK